MADESTGEDWDGGVTWVIDLLLIYSLFPLFTAAIRLIIYKV